MTGSSIHLDSQIHVCQDCGYTGPLHLELKTSITVSLVDGKFAVQLTKPISVFDIPEIHVSGLMKCANCGGSSFQKILTQSYECINNGCEGCHKCKGDADYHTLLNECARCVKEKITNLVYDEPVILDEKLSSITDLECSVCPRNKDRIHAEMYFDEHVVPEAIKIYESEQS